MSQVDHFKPVFVELMPPVLEPGHLYVSTQHAVTVHLCPCGCSEKVVLPLHPKQWRFTYDGKAISIYPSVGNVTFPCNSHYWIRNGRVNWAPAISQEKAAAGQARDRRDLARPQRPAQESGHRRSLLARLLRRGAEPEGEEDL